MAFLRAALLHLDVVLLAVVMFCCQTGSYGLTFWVPAIVNELSGYTEFQVGLFSAIPYIAAAAGMILVGRSSDRSGERFMHVAIPSLVGAAGFIAVGLFSVPGLAMAALAVAAVGDYSTRGPFWALPGNSSPAARSRIHRPDQFHGRGGRVVGPTAVGWLKVQTAVSSVPCSCCPACWWSVPSDAVLRSNRLLKTS